MRLGLKHKKQFFRSSLPQGKASIAEPDPVFCGIKACLINESVESSGETFAAIFRQWDMASGIDRQLETAVAELMKRLAAKPKK